MKIVKETVSCFQPVEAIADYTCRRRTDHWIVFGVFQKQTNNVVNIVHGGVECL